MRFLFTISYINLRILGSKGNTELCDVDFIAMLCFLLHMLEEHEFVRKVHSSGRADWPLTTGPLVWKGKNHLPQTGIVRYIVRYPHRRVIRSLSTNAVWLAYDVFVDRQQHSINNLLVSAAQIIGGASTSNIETSKLLITWRYHGTTFRAQCLRKRKCCEKIGKIWKAIKRTGRQGYNYLARYCRSAAHRYIYVYLYANAT